MIGPVFSLATKAAKDARVGYAREGGLLLLPAVEPRYFDGIGSHQTISGRVICRPYSREDFDGA